MNIMGSDKILEPTMDLAAGKTETIEVFRTNVQTKNDAARLIWQLHESFPGSQVNFDLEDRDHILRVRAADVDAEAVIELLYRHHFYCEVLPD